MFQKINGIIYLTIFNPEIPIRAKERRLPSVTACPTEYGQWIPAFAGMAGGARDETT